MTAEGQILDNTYRLVRLVAEGGMGLVYEATHTRLSGRYAIKVLPPRWSKDPDALARFDREARISSSLQHPNIVQIVDFNTAADGTEYLVMEYLRGETLAARMARAGAMPLGEVVPIVEQIASGLAAAHAHGIVHRDLKPENVLLVQVEGWEGDWAKILDFGISKVTSANLDTISPGSKGVIGTPQYMAPEQCEGRTAEINAATDQFALAVITYEMLTGRRPFAGESLGDVLCNVLNAEPPPMNVDPAVEAVVRRGLAKANGARHPSVTAFAEALREAAVATGVGLAPRRTELSGSHSYAAGEVRRTGPVKSPRRGRRMVALAATVVVTVVVGVVVHRAQGGAGLTVAGPSAAALDSLGRVVPLETARMASPAAATRVPETDVPRPAAPVQERQAAAPLADAAGAMQPQDTTGSVADDDAERTRNDAEPQPAGFRDETLTPRMARSAPTVGSAPRAPVTRPSPPPRAARPAARYTSPARAQKLASTTWVEPRRPTSDGGAMQPPPFRPTPLDDDAIMPLDDKFNE